MFAFTHPTVERRAYRFALRPTRAQRDALVRMASARRFAYNWGLQRWRAYHSRHGKTIPFAQLLRELTALKRQDEYRWLAKADSQLLQQALFDLRQAYRNFFERRARYPRFKSRKRDAQRFRIPQRVRLDGDRIYVPKVGWVRARVSREPIGELKSATFKREPSGTWFVSLVCEFQMSRAPLALTRGDKIVGIDLGIEEFAVLSNGTRCESPRYARRASRQLRRAHRALSRKQRGSRKRERARVRLSRLYRRTANQRQDFLHKLTTELVGEYDVIAIEDLGVTGLARTKLARAIHDSGFHEFRRQLVYKTRWSGKRLVIVDRFYPSSRRCSDCGAVNADLRPRVRRWRCGCGAEHDRDLNAAHNLRSQAMEGLVAVGRTDTENARGALIRPPTEAVGDEAGISR
jgi:putative transposase